MDLPKPWPTRWLEPTMPWGEDPPEAPLEAPSYVIEVEPAEAPCELPE